MEPGKIFSDGVDGLSDVLFQVSMNLMALHVVGVDGDVSCSYCAFFVYADVIGSPLLGAVFICMASLETEINFNKHHQQVAVYLLRACQPGRCCQ